MSHKRRWWDADERFKKVQENLRKNYDAAIKRKEIWYEEQVGKLGLAHLKEEQETRERYGELLVEEQRKAAVLAKEIADFRMLLDPREGSRPLVMSAQFAIDDRFLYNARDLKDIGPYIVERLCRQIQMEFTKIDWARPAEYRSLWDEAQQRRWPTFNDMG